MHTSPGIAERHEPLTRAVRGGGADRLRLTEPHRPAHDLIREIEQRYPRDGIERVLAHAVVTAARAEPAKAPASSWPADLVRGADLIGDSQADNPFF